MIKKIRSSLTIKIFLMTSLLLALACVLTYSFIAWFMPLTYTSDLSIQLDRKLQKLVNELKNTDLQNCEDIFERFIMEVGSNVGINFEILDAQGNSIDIPINRETSYIHNGVFIGVMITESESTITESESISNMTVTSIGDSMSMTTNKEYPFTFVDSDDQYVLVVSSVLQGVNQAVEALERILPWLIVTILCISFLGSLFYSRYVTRPIIKLSGISKRMSNLEFDWHCKDNRKDEIGVLAHSLNELSRRLSNALRELQQANIELKSDIDRERELERKRMEFFSAVSHELKTPITVIKGQIEGMLLHVGVYKDRDKYLSRALTVAGTMEELVQEILTISRMETYEFSLHKEELDFSKLVHKQILEHAELLEKKNLIPKTEIDEYIPIIADFAMINKVLVNLISNAAYYSPENQLIRIKAKAEESGMLFIIENTGIHIPQEVLPRLFEAFYRVEQSRNRQSGGSGLGLYIVKMILEQHGADYKIENTADGVQFTFKLK
ncbi:HAMP domain-containing sensor histidine kinase [Tissierella sp.]|uniref:sensor histidine kinase n=1 Tax=Tissierella sp. TaxID=41274 RepID=UPI00305C2DE8